MNTIVVTGASGFLGQYLVDELAADSSLNVIGLYNSQKPRDVHDNVTYQQCDLREPRAIDDIISQCDGVIHSAAIVSFNSKEEEAMLTFNVESTKHVVNASLHHGIQRLVHVSSISALGRSGSLIDEDINTYGSRSYSPYGKSKYLSEMEVWRGMQEGLQANIINPSLIIGSGDWTKGSPKMITTVANGMRYYPTGSTGFVFAQDVAKMAIKLLTTTFHGERFICNSENLTYKTVMEEVAAALNVTAPSLPIKPLHIRLVKILGPILNVFRNDTNSIVTAKSLVTANQNLSYSNKKSKEKLNFDYTPIKEAVKKICAAYPT